MSEHTELLGHLAVPIGILLAGAILVAVDVATRKSTIKGLKVGRRFVMKRLPDGQIICVEE